MAGDTRTAVRMVAAFAAMAAVSAASLLLPEGDDVISAGPDDAATTSTVPAATTTARATTTTSPIIEEIGPNVGEPSFFDITTTPPTSGCFKVSSASGVADVAVTSCASPHQFQVYHSGDVGAEVGAYADVTPAVEAVCSERFLANVRSAVAPKLSWGYSYPSEAGWPVDRTFMCFAFLPDEALFTGDVLEVGP